MRQGRISGWSSVAATCILAVAGIGCGSNHDTGGGGSPDGGSSHDGSSWRHESGSDGATPQKDGATATKDAAADGGAGHGHVTVPGTYNLGMNIEGLSYYNNSAVYADMALALAGNNGPWDAKSGMGAATLDANGSPTEAATTAITADYPSGAYAVSWDGTGTFSVNGGGSMAPTLGTVTTTMSGGVQHNTVTMTFTQQLSTVSSAAWFGFEATPPISNLHIMAPSSAVVPGSIFLTDFTERMQPFSTVRFMDALNTNGNVIQNWSQRTWPTGGSRGNTPQGMAYEDIIAMANETGVDVWINVPALATDDYVCRLARLFHYGEQGDMSNSACDPTAPAGTATTAPLAAGSTVYVEYSNEVWNWSFQQIEDIYCMVWGKPDMTTDGKHCDVTAPTSMIGTAALADTSLPWTDSNTYTKTTQFTLVLVKRVSDIFRTVFGCKSGAGCQAQIPMNVQAAYAAEVDPGFAFLKAAYGSTSSIDAMAVAPYFSFDTGDDTTVDALFTDITGTILSSSPSSSEGSAIVNWLKGDLAEASMYGLPIIGYEGGQGLVDYSSASGNTNTITAQSDPRMYAAYQQYFALWDTLIGKSHLLNQFDFAGCYGSYGSWGALVNQDDPGSQKWDALVSLTRLAGDANLDGAVNALDCAIVKAHYGMSGMWWMQGDFDHDGMVDAADLTAMNANITGPKCTE
jgi:hypothetical protein